MSLELALQENTAALHALIAALSDGLPQPAKQEKAAPKKAEPDKKAPAVETAPEEKPDAPGKLKKALQAQAAKEASQAATSQPTRIETAEWITKLVDGKGTAAAKAVLAQHNATHLNGIDPTEYAAVIAACQQALEA